MDPATLATAALTILAPFAKDAGKELVKAVGENAAGEAIDLFASSDETLKLWRLENLREVQTLTGHTDSVLAAAIALNGRGRGLGFVRPQSDRLGLAHRLHNSHINRRLTPDSSNCLVPRQSLEHENC